MGVMGNGLHPAGLPGWPQSAAMADADPSATFVSAGSTFTTSPQAALGQSPCQIGIDLLVSHCCL